MLLLMKILFASSIFVLTLCTGLIPFKASNRNCFLMRMANAFSSAIFLGAALLHLLPDAVAQFDKFYQNDYPLAYLICVLVMVLLVAIERSLHLDAPHGAVVPIDSVRLDTTTNGELQQSCGHHHHAGCACCLQTRMHAGCFLTALLCLHSFIEGAAIGIPDDLMESLVIFAAVFAHKGSESFAFGCHLSSLGMTQQLNKKLMVIFAMVTPLGILIASSIIRFLSECTGIMFSALFDAITAGTFLYLGTEHLVEGDKGYKRGFEMISLLLGVGLMAVLALWV